MPGGRPSLYQPEMAEKICERLALGESLRSICASTGMPTLTCVMNWLNRFPEFVAQYSRARELQAEYVFDEVTEIADVVDEEPNAINKARLRIDTRKWAAARMSPRKYGDKVETTLRGDAENPIAIENVSARELIASRIASLSARLRADSNTGEAE